MIIPKEITKNKKDFLSYLKLNSKPNKVTLVIKIGKEIKIETVDSFTDKLSQSFYNEIEPNIWVDKTIKL